MFGLSKEAVAALRKAWPAGTRIVCHSMKGEPRYAGRHGEVVYVDDAGQVHVAWDGGGSLALIYGEDEWGRDGSGAIMIRHGNSVLVYHDDQNYFIIDSYDDEDI